MTSSVLWRPNERQEIFLRSDAFEAFYGGAVGGGKSDALLMGSLYDIKHTDYHALILRATYPELQELMDRALLMFPACRGRWNEQKKRWVFPSGALIEFGYCEAYRDVLRYQGRQFQYIGWDELGHCAEERVWTYLMSRCRSTNRNIVRRMRATGNPGGPGHAWIKNRFIDRCDWDGEPWVDPASGTSRAFVFAKLQDNPQLMQGDPEYLARLQLLPEAERRTLLEGDWDVFAGQYFGELRRDIHGFDVRDDLPPESAGWKRYRSYDWGFAKPASMGWWMVDPDGNPFRYRELYRTGTEVEDFMAEVLRLSGKEEYRYTVADPSLWDGSRGVSIAERASNAGVDLAPADNERVPGWSLMRKYVSPKTVPLLRVAHTCADWWRTVPSLVHDDKHVEDLDSDGEDHAADDTRYFLASRPEPTFVAAPEPHERFRPWEPEYHEHQERPRILGPLVTKPSKTSRISQAPEIPGLGGYY